MEQEYFDDDWNDELEEETSSSDRALVVFSRDWTVETIVRQIERGNIDLNPKFQRRNAWNDLRRSKLIESLLLNVPIPEIVLAEDNKKKNSFIVIDGKQRLLALAGFIHPEKKIWNNAKLQGLKSLGELNTYSYNDFMNEGNETQEATDLLNADIRCTVISNYSSTDVLYDIFYRLNTGSVPLSSQELRQVLIPGEFANYLIEKTNNVIPLHSVLRTDGPDTRLRDAEILLRFIALHLFGSRYEGSLMKFLNLTMSNINGKWEHYEEKINSLLLAFNQSVEFLLSAFPENKVGRKFTNDKWESRFNRALFEVQAFYFSKFDAKKLKTLDKRAVLNAFSSLCKNDKDFQKSIETSTKTIENYEVRFTKFQDAMNKALKLKIEAVPVVEI